jgi:hypothetical protein
MRSPRFIASAILTLAGLVFATGFGPQGKTSRHTADCSPWSSDWRHPDLNLVFESSTCDWSSTDDKVLGRFYNGENRPLKIEGRVWASQPASCTRGANEVMFFYQTIPSGGYSGNDFTIQPRGRQLWVCARLAEY